MNGEVVLGVSRLDRESPLIDELGALLGERLSTSPAVRERV